jgi:hypothetical protein
MYEPRKIVVENLGRIALSMGYRVKLALTLTKWTVFQLLYEFCPVLKLIEFYNSFRTSVEGELS